MNYVQLMNRFISLSDESKQDNNMEILAVRNCLYRFLSMNVPGVIDDVIKNNAMIELTNEKLANFATNFLAYYKEYIISAHFDESQI